MNQKIEGYKCPFCDDVLEAKISAKGNAFISCLSTYCPKKREGDGKNNYWAMIGPNGQVVIPNDRSRYPANDPRSGRGKPVPNVTGTKVKYSDKFNGCWNAPRKVKRIDTAPTGVQITDIPMNNNPRVEEVEEDIDYESITNFVPTLTREAVVQIIEDKFHQLSADFYKLYMAQQTEIINLKTLLEKQKELINQINEGVDALISNKMST